MLILNWIKRRLRKCRFTLDRMGSDDGRGTRSATSMCRTLWLLW